MHKVKRTGRLMLSLLMALLIVVGATSTAYAAISDAVTAAAEKAVWAEGATKTGSVVADIDNVKWYKHTDGKYYLFMPTTADFSNLIIHHTYGNLTINSQTITSGTAYNIYTVTGASAGAKKIECNAVADGNSVKLVFMKSSKYGTVFLNTVSGSMNAVNADKSYKEAGDILIIDAEGTVQYDNALDSIKGRGNSTWGKDKKPYNLKLNKNAELFGFGKSKKWTLLANAQEHSMIRNHMIYNLADEVGLSYSPGSYFVDFYANGVYMGAYQLTEKVEQGKNKLVNTTDLQGLTEEANPGVDIEAASRTSTKGAGRSGDRTYYNIANNPADITGGYMLEYVMSPDSGASFTTTRNQVIDITGPEVATKNQVNYIADFVQDMENALAASNGKNSKGKHYTEYLDIESYAKMYIIEEFSMNVDAGISSCNFWKESDTKGDGKLHAGPIWDYDVAFGNLAQVKEGISMTSYDSLFASISERYGQGDTIWKMLCKHKDFLAEVERVWNEDFVKAFDILFGKTEGTGRLQSFDEMKNVVSDASALNYTIWGYTLSDGNHSMVPHLAGTTQASQINYLINWVEKRYEFMDSVFGSIDDAKEKAIKEIQDFYNSYDQSLLTASQITAMTTAKNNGISSINKATTAVEVANLKNSTIENIKKAAGGLMVYFDNNETKWEEVCIYWWGGSSSAAPQWPGVKMTEGEDGIYYFLLEAGAENVIFTNGKDASTGEKEQTIDLNVPTSSANMFVTDISTGTYDESKEAIVYGGSWKTSNDNTPDKVKYGDVNFDGKVSMRDIMEIQKYIAYMAKFDEKQLIAADVTGDGKVKMADIMEIQKYIAFIITVFPVEK